MVCTAEVCTAFTSNVVGVAVAVPLLAQAVSNITVKNTGIRLDVFIMGTFFWRGFELSAA
jgi:hypothetical protein